MKFKKYQSLGNDFIVLEKVKFKQKTIIEKMCQFHFGVGADGVLILHPENSNSFKLEVYNKDGSFASMCGNGLKIVGKYLHEKYPNYSIFNIYINDQEYKVEVDKEVKVYLPIPKFVIKKKYPIYAIGNLHMIQENMEKDEQIKIAQIYKNINITSYSFLKENEVKILTLEAGVGFTLSCGSASLCLFKHLLDNGYTNDELIVHSDGGIFKITRQNEQLVLHGNPSLVFIGEMNDAIF